jgi:pilus assembly protein CpaE
MSILIAEPDPAVARSLRSGMSVPSDVVTSLTALRRMIDSHRDIDVVILGSSIDMQAGAQFAGTARVTRPELGVILVRRELDRAILTEAMRSGMREAVEERDLESLGRAVQEAQRVADEIRSAVGHRPNEPMSPRGMVVTIFSAKGGAGKTTIATNLSAALAQRGERQVCLVDLDLAFGDVAIALQLFPAHTIADAVPIQDHLDDAGLQGLLTPHSPGLTTLVAPIQPDAKDSISADLIGRLLELLRARFDYVVVDTPPAFDDHVLAATDRTDVLLLVTTLDVPAIKNLKLTLETLELLNFPRDRWRIVLNRANSKVGLLASEVEKTLRAPIAAQIPSSRDVPAAINRGVTIFQDDPRHPVSYAVRELAGQIAHAERVKSAQGADEGSVSAERRGILRRRSRSS